MWGGGKKKNKKGIGVWMNKKRGLIFNLFSSIAGSSSSNTFNKITTIITILSLLITKLIN